MFEENEYQRREAVQKELVSNTMYDIEGWTNCRFYKNLLPCYAKLILEIVVVYGL